MSRRPWMPFYVEDFRLDTLDLGPDEIGVYFIMICLAWRRGDGGVPADLTQLKLMLQRCIANFHGHTFNRIVPKLLKRYFHLDGQFYYQKRVVLELQNADKRSANASQIARKRWSQTRKNNDLDDANAMQVTVTVTKEESEIDFFRKEEKKSISDSGGRVATRPDRFEEFWTSYPKRDGANPKQPARKLFLAAMKAGATADEIIAGAKATAERDRDKIGTPYIPQAVKWLRDQRWKDHTPAAPANPTYGWSPGKRTAAEILASLNPEPQNAERNPDRLENTSPVDENGDRFRQGQPGLFRNRH